MLYGRLILIDNIHYNKIIDIEAFAYFVAINNPTSNFIKVKIACLDKKSYNYSNSLILATSNLLTNLISLDQILLYSPFVNKTISKKKNYYKKKSEPYQISQISNIINFD